MAGRIDTLTSAGTTLAASVPPRARRAGAVLAAWLLVTGSCPGAWAFDMAGYKARLDALAIELGGASIPDSAATLERLEEMVSIGSQAAGEYAARQPRYARLMAAVVADAPAMRAMTGNELEDKWGERGFGGDASDVPIRSLDQFGNPRAYIELVIVPATAYAFVSRWTKSKKAFWLEEAKDEATELQRHLGHLQLAQPAADEAARPALPGAAAPTLP